MEGWQDMLRSVCFAYTLGSPWPHNSFPQLQCTFISENNIPPVPLHVVPGPLFSLSYGFGQKIRLTPHNPAVKPMLMCDLDNSHHTDIVSLHVDAPRFTGSANKAPQKIPYLSLVQHLWPSRDWKRISVSTVCILSTPALDCTLGTLILFCKIVE